MLKIKVAWIGWKIRITDNNLWILGCQTDEDWWAVQKKYVRSYGRIQAKVQWTRW